MNDRVFIIAEAGVNHNGSLDMAIELVDCAAAAGADAVKFQTFRADALVSKRALKAAYQTTNLSDAEISQHEMLKRLELDFDAFVRLAEHCASRGIEFMSTPFDIASARFLVEKTGVKRLKVSSGDLTNAPLLHGLAQLGLPIILSSGMALLADIEQALGVVAHALTSGNAPGPDHFRKAYSSAEGRAALLVNVSLLHCTTQYPADPQLVNLRAMDLLASAFAVPIGYSDHTAGIAVSLAATARGAKIIEKHFTLDRKLPGPDHLASLEPNELRSMIEGIRTIEKALGSPQKMIAPVEEETRKVAGKSILAGRDIRAGEVFSEDNLVIKRPLGGAAPIEWWNLLGRTAARDYLVDDAVRLD